MVLSPFFLGRSKDCQIYMKESGYFDSSPIRATANIIYSAIRQQRIGDKDKTGTPGALVHPIKGDAWVSWKSCA